MRLLGLVFDNFGLKVLALGMAWAVWFMVTQSLNDVKPARIALDLRVADPSAVSVTLTDPPELASSPAVTIRVSGPARTVADFLRVSPDLAARFEIGPDLYPADNEDYRELSLEDLVIPGLDDFPALRAVDMQPEQIRVRIERMEVRDTPVKKPDFEAPGTVEVKVVTWDTMVKARASAKHFAQRLASIRTTIDSSKLETMAAALGEAPSRTDDVALTIDPIQASLFELVDRDHITARIELRQLESAAVTVPLQIFRVADDTAHEDRPLRFSPLNAVDPRLEGIYEPGADGAPPRLQLVLEGSPGAIAAVDPAQIKVFVLADEMPADKVLDTLTVHIAGLPAGIRVRTQIALQVERER